MSHRPPSNDSERTQPYGVAPPSPPTQPVVPPTAAPPRGSRRRGSIGWSPGAFSPAIFLVAIVIILLLIGAGVLSQRGTANDPAVPGAVSTAPGGGRTGPTPTARATGKVFIVGNTGGEGVYLRRTPRLEDRDTAYRDGARLEQIGPDVTAGGLTWRHVRAPDGKTGYVPAQYTVESR